MGEIGLAAVLALVFGGVVGLGILVGPLLWRHVLSPRARMRRSLRRLSPTRIAKVQDGQIAGYQAWRRGLPADGIQECRIPCPDRFRHVVCRYSGHETCRCHGECDP